MAGRNGLDEVRKHQDSGCRAGQQAANGAVVYASWRQAGRAAESSVRTATDCMRAVLYLLHGSRSRSFEGQKTLA